MAATGGSYMSQPCTNSEAVRRCLNIPIQPMSSQVARMQPKPPYAVGGDAGRVARPTSGMVKALDRFIIAHDSLIVRPQDKTV